MLRPQTDEESRQRELAGQLGGEEERPGGRDPGEGAAGGGGSLDQLQRGRGPGQGPDDGGPAGQSHLGHGEGVCRHLQENPEQSTSLTQHINFI